MEIFTKYNTKGIKHMGELLKKCGNLQLKGHLYDVELNAPLHTQTGGIIHIQSRDVRLEMTQIDFYKFVTTVNLAKKNLLRIKGVEDE